MKFQLPNKTKKILAAGGKKAKTRNPSPILASVGRRVVISSLDKIKYDKVNK